MPATLDCHEATHEEKLCAYRNVHEFWGGGLPVDEFVVRRLASPKHEQVRWYVGTLGGEVVTSLGWYPRALEIDGVIEPVLGIGSVHTTPRYRGKGYAAALLRHVIDVAVSRGVKIGLLFSDICPAYYLRFGFFEWPSTSEVMLVNESPGDWSGVRLEEVRDALDCVDEFARLHAAASRHSQVVLHRDQAYWQACVGKQPRAEYYRVLDEDSLVGYARVRILGRKLLLEDYALNASGSKETAFFDSVQSLAHRRGCLEVEGWLPGTELVNRLFESKRRELGIAMLACFDGASRFDPTRPDRAHFWMADYF